MLEGAIESFTINNYITREDKITLEATDGSSLNKRQVAHTT